MLTPYGREIRKLRIDHTTKLKELADKIGVTSAFMSSVENGRKSIPPDWSRKITEILKLTSEEQLRLEKSISATAKAITIPLENRGIRSRELATAFARRFPALTDAEVDAMFDVLSAPCKKKNWRGS